MTTYNQAGVTYNHPNFLYRRFSLPPIRLVLSTTAGAAGNSLSSSGAASLGKYISTTEAPAGALGVFDDVSGAENAANDVEYRCLFVKNLHATLAVLNVAVYVLSQVSGGATIALGADPTAASAIGSGSAQAVSVASEDTAPAGVTFVTTAINPGTAVQLGNIPAGQAAALWLRRTAANTPVLTGDGLQLVVVGDMAA